MKNGLKGVTDATVFCKSMRKGGPAAMIQPMSKYMAGGTTGLQSPNAVTSESECSGSKPKPGCKKTFGKRSIPRVVKKALIAGAGLGAGAIAYAKNAFGVKDTVKDLMGQKKGGSVNTGGIKKSTGRTKK
jgi:hypothetical protein